MSNLSCWWLTVTQIQPIHWQWSSEFAFLLVSQVTVLIVQTLLVRCNFDLTAGSLSNAPRRQLCSIPGPRVLLGETHCRYGLFNWYMRHFGHFRSWHSWYFRLRWCIIFWLLDFHSTIIVLSKDKRRLNQRNRDWILIFRSNQ